MVDFWRWLTWSYRLNEQKHPQSCCVIVAPGAVLCLTCWMCYSRNIDLHSGWWLRLILDQHWDGQCIVSGRLSCVHPRLCCSSGPTGPSHSPQSHSYETRTRLLTHDEGWVCLRMCWHRCVTATRAWGHSTEFSTGAGLETFERGEADSLKDRGAHLWLRAHV